jgi:hypothetical protein
MQPAYVSLWLLRSEESDWQPLLAELLTKRSMFCE